MGDIDLDAFIRERNEVLVSLDEARIRAFHRRWNDHEMSADPVVFWGAVYKAITALPGLPADLRRRARAHLESMGMRPLG